MRYCYAINTGGIYAQKQVYGKNELGAGLPNQTSETLCMFIIYKDYFYIIASQRIQYVFPVHLL